MAKQSTNVLEQEHRRIQKVVATMSLVADQLDAGNNVDLVILATSPRFFTDSPRSATMQRKRDFCFLYSRPKGCLRQAAPLRCCITNTKKAGHY